MQNSEKKRDAILQLMRGCQEMAFGFEMMLEKAEMTPDDWGQAVNALSEAQAVARVHWAEAVAELGADSAGSPPSPLPANEYSVQLLDAKLEPMAGQSFPAASDDAAEDETRAFALEHSWARLARLLHKSSGRAWSIEVNK